MTAWQKLIEEGMNTKHLDIHFFAAYRCCANHKAMIAFVNNPLMEKKTIWILPESRRHNNGNTFS